MWLQTALDGLHKKMVRLSRQITKSDQQRWLYFSGQLVQSENFYLCVGNKLCECLTSQNQVIFIAVSDTGLYPEEVVSENWHWWIWKRCPCLRQNIPLVCKQVRKILTQKWLGGKAEHVRTKAHNWAWSTIKSVRIQVKRQKVSEVAPHPLALVNFNICPVWLFPQEAGHVYL